MLGNAFPELARNQSFVREIVSDEETVFGRTLKTGVRVFERTLARTEVQSPWHRRALLLSFITLFAFVFFLCHLGSSSIGEGEWFG